MSVIKSTGSCRCCWNCRLSNGYRVEVVASTGLILSADVFEDGHVELFKWKRAGLMALDDQRQGFASCLEKYKIKSDLYYWPLLNIIVSMVEIFKRFLGLRSNDTVPDSKTLWLFREQLAQHILVDKLFNAFDQQLWYSGLIPKGGQII